MEVASEYLAKGRTMLCDECKVNQATCHICEMIDGKHGERHLCQACASKSQSPLAHAFAGMAQARKNWDGKCEYCGSTDAILSQGFTPLTKDQTRSICLKCVQKYSRFFQRKMKALSMKLSKNAAKSVDAVTEQMRKVEAEADKYLRRQKTR